MYNSLFSFSHLLKELVVVVLRAVLVAFDREWKNAASDCFEASLEFRQFILDGRPASAANCLSNALTRRLFSVNYLVTTFLVFSA